MTPAQKQHFSDAMKTAAAKRKAEGIVIHRQPLSQATKDRLRAERTLRPKRHETAAQKAAQSLRMKGKHHTISEATRQKLSAAAKKRWKTMDPKKREKIIRYLIAKGR